MEIKLNCTCKVQSTGVLGGRRGKGWSLQSGPSPPSEFHFPQHTCVHLTQKDFPQPSHVCDFAHVVLECSFFPGLCVELLLFLQHSDEIHFFLNALTNRHQQIVPLAGCRVLSSLSPLMLYTLHSIFIVCIRFIIRYYVFRLKNKEIPIYPKKKMITYGREAVNVFYNFKHH